MFSIESELDTILPGEIVCVCFLDLKQYFLCEVDRENMAALSNFKVELKLFQRDHCNGTNWNSAKWHYHLKRLSRSDLRSCKFS